MLRMTATTNPIRFAWAALFALLLALRLLGSTGYMPATEHGSIAIVACPDADVNAPLALGAMHHHHHGPAKHNHNLCPYAAAGALGALENPFVPLLAVVLVGIALRLGRPLLFIER